MSKEPWCKSPEIEAFPHDDPWNLILTQEFEQDIQERFSDLVYDNGWRFKLKPRKYKIIACLRYQPMIADADFHRRKVYCLAKPVMDNNIITNWELEWLPSWKGWLPL